MDLKEFVKESIVQISKGILEANEELRDTEGLVNPSSLIPEENTTPTVYRTGSPLYDYENVTRLAHTVNFDVAISAERGQNSGGGLKLSIASFGINGESKSSVNDKLVSRIQFNIPVIFPSDPQSEIKMSRYTVRPE